MRNPRRRSPQLPPVPVSPHSTLRPDPPEYYFLPRSSQPRPVLRWAERARRKRRRCRRGLCVFPAWPCCTRDPRTPHRSTSTPNPAHSPTSEAAPPARGNKGSTCNGIRSDIDAFASGPPAPREKGAGSKCSEGLRIPSKNEHHDEFRMGSLPRIRMPNPALSCLAIPFDSFTRFMTAGKTPSERSASITVNP